MSSQKVWLITGASSGFGRSVTERVLSQGDIAVATLRKPEVLADLVAKYSKETLLVLPLDVSKPQQILEAFAKTREVFGRLDVVFNNAGYGVLGEIEGTPDDAARAMFEVDFWGAANVSKEAVKFFREVNSPRGGTLLNVGSMAGIEGSPAIGYYSAAKFALEGFTAALAKEVDPAWNIKISILEPGGFATRGSSKSSLIRTPVHPAYDNDSLRSKMTRNFLENDAKLPGDPDKAAKLIYKISQLPELPLNFPIGKDAIQVVRQRVAVITASTDDYESWSEDLMITY